MSPGFRKPIQLQLFLNVLVKTSMVLKWVTDLEGNDVSCNQIMSSRNNDKGSPLIWHNEI